MFLDVSHPTPQRNLVKGSTLFFRVHPKKYSYINLFLSGSHFNFDCFKGNFVNNSVSGTWQVSYSKSSSTIIWEKETRSIHEAKWALIILVENVVNLLSKVYLIKKKLTEWFTIIMHSNKSYI